MYSDVRAVLDSALEHGGGIFRCDTYGMAVHWRQRAYKFRKLYAEMMGVKAESPYDQLVLHAILPGETVVNIRIRQRQGVFEPADGATMPADEIDELEAAAARLAASLGGD